MSNTIFLTLHEASCALLFVTVFCRLVHTSQETTQTMVRFAFCTLGYVSIAGMVWPWSGLPMDWYAVLLGFTIVFIQLVTAHFWRLGVPAQFHFKE